jgi:hypothetical protein
MGRSIGCSLFDSSLRPFSTLILAASAWTPWRKR